LNMKKPALNGWKELLAGKHFASELEKRTGTGPHCNLERKALMPSLYH